MHRRVWISGQRSNFRCNMATESDCHLGETSNQPTGCARTFLRNQSRGSIWSASDGWSPARIADEIIRSGKNNSAILTCNRPIFAMAAK